MLKKYYEEVLRPKGMPSFDKLNGLVLLKIENSYSFASWKLSKAMEEVNKQLLEVAKKIETRK